jgi:hypothetical protein
MQDDDGKTIFGTDLDFDRCDELMFDFYLKKLRISAEKGPSYSNFRKFDELTHLETALFRKKWFDYRYLHPVAATYLYAHHYQVVYRQAFKRHISRDISEHIKVLKDEDLFNCPQRFVADMWRGRQIADAFGAPYNFVIEAGIRHTLRFWKQKYLPRPGQIFSDWVCDLIAAEWDEWKRVRAPHADHFEYRLPHYVGTRDQDEHHDHLLDLAGARSDPTALLSRFVDQELISLDKIGARFGDHLVERMREAA